MSSMAAEDTRSSTVAKSSAQLNFSIATCFQRSRRVVFAESTIASSNFLFSAFRTTRLGSTKSGRRPPVTACSSKASDAYPINSARFGKENELTCSEAPNFRNTSHRSRSFLGTGILATESQHCSFAKPALLPQQTRYQCPIGMYSETT